MMQNHTFFKVLLVTVLGACPMLCQAEAILGRQSSSKRVAAMTQDKTAMTPEEQQFAMKLSALHRQIFTMVFTPDLRKEAMALMSIPSDDMEEETPMTPDMAVEEVISNHRDVPTMQSGKMPANNTQKSTMPQKGAAPAKQTSTQKKNYWSS